MQFRLRHALSLSPRAAALPFSLACCASANAELIYGYTNGGDLVSFDSASPNSILTTATITGLAPGDSLRGIDFRANAVLYAVSAQSRLYTLNTTTAAATQVGASSFSPTLTASSQGFDFNPVNSAIRIVGSNGQNLRLDPDTGAVLGVDPTLSGISGAQAVGLAYTASGSAYVIDFSNDVLASLNLATGALTSIGATGVNAQVRVGFDISHTSGVAYASMFLPTSMGRTSLYSINLATGAATIVGAIGPAGGLQIDGIAVIPAPETAALLFGALGVCRRRRSAP